MNIVCIILAAGKSTRMKKQKMLLPINGTTVIEKVAQVSIQSKVNETYVVTGSNHTEIKKHLSNLPIQIIYNDDYERGMLSSVQKGVSGIEKCDAFIIIPGDLALITVSTINRLIETYKQLKNGLIIPTFKRRKGHPVIINSKYSEQILKLDHKIGLRQLFYENKDDTKFIELESDEILIDLDYPEDYTKALKRLNNEK